MVKVASMIPQNEQGSWTSAVQDGRAHTEGHGRTRIDKAFWCVKSGGRWGYISVLKGRARARSLSLSS